jgi:hypothetical protein
MKENCRVSSAKCSANMQQELYLKMAKVDSLKSTTINKSHRMTWFCNF